MLIIIDLDGVVYRGKKVIPGAPETIARLRERGHKIRFLTNNSSLTRQGFSRRLWSMGIKCRQEDIMSSGYATVLFLKKRGLRGNVFVIGGEGLAREMEKAGFRVVNKNTYQKIDYVAVGMDRHFVYRDLYIAQQAILKGALFLATNADAMYPVENGVMPGAGAMVSAIKTAAQTPPIIIGKPNPFILKEILREAGISRKESIIVGDRLDSDISLGHRAGIKTILVLTGITSPVEAEKFKKETRPDYVIKNIKGLLKLKQAGL
ncbi:MAG: HAD-IIA family hydrolase [Desulfocucumaceae bacterium]